MTVIVPLNDANGKPGDRLNPFIPQGIAGTTKASRVMCQQVRAVDKSRVGRKYGNLPPDIMKLVDEGLRAILDL
jgi:mRNA-degrading endonuclease toxin of MazEF toxin-antitoxin module